MKRLLALVIIALPLSTASAQDFAKARVEKSPRHLEYVKVKSGNRDLTCFIAYPEVKEKATAVIVIHEIFGLADWVRSVTDQLAEAGYIAIAPDLLSGLAPGGGGTSELGSGDAVRKAIMGLSPAHVTADLDATANYVKSLPACNGKVVVCGFCWGGGQAFRYAENNKDVKASFVFYGSGPAPDDDVVRIACPVYGFYGGNDARINAGIPATETRMKAAGKTYEPKVYEGAGHGFMRAGEAPGASEANKKARDEAWERWKAILKGL